MTAFKLTQKASNRSRTTFHVIDSAGAVCGSINVANNQAADLLRCWTGTAPAKDSSKQSPRAALAAAFLKGRKPSSKASILRGCNG